MEVRNRWRVHWTALGVLAGLLGVTARAASPAAADLRGRQRPADSHLWAQKMQLDIEGETIHELLFRIRQDLLVHIRPGNELEDEPLSAFAADCTLGDVRDALADLFHFDLSAVPNFESFIFMLSEDPAARRAALAVPQTPSRKPARRSRKHLPPHPAAASITDPELLKPLSIPKELSPIRDQAPSLPAIQRRLAKVAGIRIFSDYAERTEDSLGSVPAETFFRSLNGMPLHAALDKLAARFDYTWRKSGGWYLFRSRTWQAERRARAAGVSDAEEGVTGRAERIHP